MINKQVEKELNIISEKYRKYIVSIKLLNEEKYFIWGADLTENEEDKLLLDLNGNIVTSLNTELLLSNLIKLKNKIIFFDKKNLFRWKKYIETICKKYNRIVYRYSKYDLDLILKYFVLNSKISVIQLPEKVLNEFVDFINLVNDFALQIKDSKLLKLTHDHNIRLLWNYSYDNYIFKKGMGNKLFKEISFNEEIFKKSLMEILFRFNDKLRII